MNHISEPNTKKSFTERLYPSLHYICMNAIKHLKNDTFLSNTDVLDICKA